MNKYMVYGKDVKGVTHTQKVQARTTNEAMMVFIDIEYQTEFEVLIVEKMNKTT